MASAPSLQWENPVLMREATFSTSIPYVSDRYALFSREAMTGKSTGLGTGTTQAGAHKLPFFGSRLRKARRAQGIKQAAIADLLGIDQATVSRWEAGIQVPSSEMQEAAFRLLGRRATSDEALRRLVESSASPVHLIEEASHVCLAYSPVRAREWRVSCRALLGRSLWRFATDDIQREEEALADAGWWDRQWPEARQFKIAPREFDAITITAGDVLWERLYLADGTPVRLVTGLA